MCHNTYCEHGKISPAIKMLHNLVTYFCTN